MMSTTSKDFLTRPTTHVIGSLLLLYIMFTSNVLHTRTIMAFTLHTHPSLPLHTCNIMCLTLSHSVTTYTHDVTTDVKSHYNLA